MKPITIERVEEWNFLFEDRCDEFLCHTRLSTLFHEDNVEKIRALAKKLRVPPEELSIYLWLRTYIAELRESCEEIPSMETVAQQMGINIDQLETYAFRQDCQEQANLFEEFSTPHDPDFDEWDLLGDLQQDGGDILDGLF